MAYDSARSQVVLFGGYGGSAFIALHDTWVWRRNQLDAEMFPVRPPGETCSRWRTILRIGKLCCSVDKARAPSS